MAWVYVQPLAMSTHSTANTGPDQFEVLMERQRPAVFDPTKLAPPGGCRRPMTGANPPLR